jgi:hypothetical protein
MDLSRTDLVLLFVSRRSVSRFARNLTAAGEIFLFFLAARPAALAEDRDL